MRFSQGHLPNGRKVAAAALLGSANSPRFELVTCDRRHMISSTFPKSVERALESPALGGMLEYAACAYNR